MALILALVGMATEIAIVHKIKYVDKLYTKGSNLFWVSKWHVDGVVWNSIGSFLLSYVQGAMFGATGLVIALSGALSTGLSQGYFIIEKWVQNTYGFDTIYDCLKAQVDVLKARMPQIKKQATDLWVLTKDVWRLMKFLLKVATFPFWGYRAAKTWYQTKILHTKPAI
jgi:hypothetical protein